MRSVHVRSRGTRIALVATALALPALVVTHSPPAAAGPIASAEFRVNTATTNDQTNPSVATDADGDYVVTWHSNGQDGGGYGIYAQRYNAAGVPQGGETLVNSTTLSDQRDPSVAMDADGDYVIAWQSNGQDGSGYGIYAQRFNAAGVPQGVETRVNTNVPDAQTNPSVAMDADGAYAITWQSVQDGGGSGIYAQRYNAAGTPQGGEILVNTITANNQANPSIAMDADGAYAVVWESAGQDGSALGVYLQQYLANGAEKGTETLVNTTTTNNQATPSIAMDADGDYAITWSSALQDGSGYGVYVQRFNAAGTPQGVETLVNTTTTNDQATPSIAMDADGDYAITWDSYLQDGSAYGVYAQRHNAAGTPQGVETRVNTYTSNNQQLSDVAMDADGDFVVTWASFGQDSSQLGIYGRRYRGPESVDLALTQADDAEPVAVGGRVTYRLRVSNLNEPAFDTGIAAIDAAIGAASGVFVVSTIPDDAAFVSSAGTGWTCTPLASTVRCRFTSPLPAGDVSPRLSLTYSAPGSSGVMLHPARVYENQSDPVPANSAEVERTKVLCSLEFSAPTYAQPESGTITATVTRNGTECGSSGVSYATQTGSATPASDYTHVAGTLSWTDGDTNKTFTVTLTDDGLDEKTEQVHLQLTNPTGALLGTGSLANANILDNDDPPRINFTTTTATATEPGALLEVTARLSETSGQDVTVNLGKTGTATHLSDYFAPARLTIPAGQRTATFGVEVVDDNLDEANETAAITLGATTTATIGTQKTWRLTITDDD